jgi:hypothetical protein
MSTNSINRTTVTATRARKIVFTHEALDAAITDQRPALFQVLGIVRLAAQAHAATDAWEALDGAAQLLSGNLDRRESPIWERANRLNVQIGTLECVLSILENLNDKSVGADPLSNAELVLRQSIESLNEIRNDVSQFELLIKQSPGVDHG